MTLYHDTTGFYRSCNREQDWHVANKAAPSIQQEVDGYENAQITMTVFFCGSVIHIAALPSVGYYFLPDADMLCYVMFCVLCAVCCADQTCRPRQGESLPESGLRGFATD